MPPLAEVQSAFRSGLLSGGPRPDGLTAPDPDDLERRFAVYRNNVVVALTGALAKRFPVIVRLVGDSFARALFAEFARQHPPQSPLMMEYGVAMPGFLAAFPPVAQLPYLPDIARLELARGAAYHAADAAPASAESLAEAAGRDPEALRLALHPSVRVVASAHPVFTIWSRNQPGSVAAGPVDWQPERVLVARRGFEVITVPLAAGEAAFVAALASGGSLAAAGDAAVAVEPGFDPAPALARLMSAGLVVGAAAAGDVQTPEETRP